MRNILVISPSGEVLRCRLAHPERYREMAAAAAD